jgi:hypothetical protein
MQSTDENQLRSRACPCRLKTRDNHRCPLVRSRDVGKSQHRSLESLDPKVPVVLAVDADPQAVTHRVRPDAGRRNSDRGHPVQRSLPTLGPSYFPSEGLKDQSLVRDDEPSPDRAATLLKSAGPLAPGDLSSARSRSAGKKRLRRIEDGITPEDDGTRTSVAWRRSLRR